MRRSFFVIYTLAYQLFSVYTLSTNGFNILKDYSGLAFFDDWEFYGFYDNLTSGDVNWVDRDSATNKRLAYVNGEGNAILKVDNFTDTIYNEKRDSVRITTKESYGVGTVWVADILHMPFGCSVWPALWSKGLNWPDDGEIDIIEGINLVENNQMALHTRTGCTHVDSPSPRQRGRPGQLDCSVEVGCAVLDTASNSYGAGFNNAGGGVYATQFDSTGIYIWFWSRQDVPKSIRESTSMSSISLDDWGIPAASYPSGPSCDIGEYFSPQNIVITITLCGMWAGNPQFYSPQCADQGVTGLCYNDNVVGAGTRTKYDNAFFEIKSLRIYSNASTPAYPPSGTSSGNATGTGMDSVKAVVTKASGFSQVQSNSPIFWTDTFPDLIVSGQNTGDWVNVRKTNNYNSQAPVTDVTSADFRCYTSQTAATASTATVAAGSTIAIGADQPIYHPGVVNVYMAKAPSNVTTFDGSGAVWFKVFQISAVTNGGTSITFPATNLGSISFTIPKNLPSGQYLVRAEHIALHAASSFAGAQFYLSCAQINVTGGGSGKPSPLVAIPGVYTGNEPGILINIYYPIPTTYTQPGPAVWSG